MNNLQIFNNPEFGQVRTLETNEKILFCGSDVAKALGYQDTVNALKQHCKSDGVVFHHIIDSLGRDQQAKFITESNLYRLIVNSKLPSAEQFEIWVFETVLPSIRKNGGYIANQETLTSEQIIANALIVADQIIKNQNARIEAQKPKVLFADAVSASNSTILIGELAKIIKGNGVDIGEKRFFEWLRVNGYLISRRGTDYNAPTQKAMNLGLFKVKETVINHSDGHITVNITTKVLGKGQAYFVNKFLDQEEN